VRSWKQKVAAWKAARKAGKAAKRPPRRPRLPAAPGYGQNDPSSLYNGMIAPLIPFAIRGAIWYQGEANTRSLEVAYQYRAVLPNMITNWREDWGQGDFPFLFVQLPNYKGRGGDQWPVIRESFLKTLQLPNTGMAVTIDIGELKNIHPKDKQDVGARLALAARHVAYGENIVYSGPIYESMRIRGNKAILTFKHVGSGLVAKGGKLAGFTIAGEDRKFVPAEAKVEGGRVVVWSSKVGKPVAVRYAWANNPTCNLYNKEGLPASPFRTDNWPIQAKR